MRRRLPLASSWWRTIAWTLSGIGLSLGCGHDERISPPPSDASDSADTSTDAGPLDVDSGSNVTADGGLGHPPIVDASVPSADSGKRPLGDADVDAGVDAGIDAAFDTGVTDAAAQDATTVEPPTVVTGAVHISPNIVFDADRLLAGEAQNDRLEVFDETLDESQVLGNPANVGGYLGPLVGRVYQEGEAPPLDAGVGADAALVGPWRDVGPIARMDAVDYYRVELRRGQAVTLFIQPAPLPTGETAPVADLDLYLLDNVNREIGQGGLWVDDSLGSADTEQVVAPSDGRYWLAVHRSDDPLSVNGSTHAARYTLVVNVPLSPSVQEQVSANKLSTQVESLEQVALVRRSVDVTSLAKTLEVEPLPRASSDRRSTLRAIKRLRRQRGVELAEPVLRFEAQGLPSPDDPLFQRQWYHWPVDLLAGWVESERAERPLGEDVVVAVVDTGIASAHPDFVNLDGSSQLLDDGYDMVSDEVAAADGDGRDPDPEDPGDRAVAGGGTFHGTHCAGNIAAATFNATGIVGVAPAAKILPVRVLGRGGGTLDDVVEGVLYAAGLPNASGTVPARPADIINLSIAGSGRSQALADAIAAARAAGAIVIAAAGNYGSPLEDYTPASEPGVVTVSAVDPDMQLAWYSNYSLTTDGVQLAGVGGDSLMDRDADGEPDGVFATLFRDDGMTLYGDIEGTSMAAAQVAGVAALMKAAHPKLTPAEFDQLIPSMVIDVGEPGPDTMFGHGLVNVPMAVAAALALSGAQPQTRPVAHLSRQGLDFGTEFDELPIELTNTGPSGLVLEAVRATEDWVSIQPGRVGRNLVRINRAALSVGEHFAVVTFETNVGAVDVLVRVAREEIEVRVDVGELFVALVDEQTGAVVAHTVTSAIEGYEFSFGLPDSGRYRVVAGSDWGLLGQLGGAADLWAELPFGGGVICGLDHAADADCVDPRAVVAPATLQRAALTQPVSVGSQ